MLLEFGGHIEPHSVTLCRRGCPFPPKHHPVVAGHVIESSCRAHWFHTTAKWAVPLEDRNSWSSSGFMPSGTETEGRTSVSLLLRISIFGLHTPLRTAVRDHTGSIQRNHHLVSAECLCLIITPDAQHIQTISDIPTMSIVVCNTDIG